jgi:hypothetical protein
MKKSLVAFLLVCCLAVAVVPYAAAQAAQKPQIKDPAEYNAYVNAVQQSDPAAKAAAIEAFLQTYPNSVMKNDALEALLGAYQQAGNAQKMVDAATRLVQADPNNVKALAILTYIYRTSINAQNLQQNLDLIQQYASKGQEALPKMTKSEGTSDADFNKLHNELGAIFDGGLGFVALQKKDNATASKDFREAVGLESQPTIADVYPLAQADLEAKPMNPEGFWFAVKAAQMAQGPGQQQILDYAAKKYKRYHGSDEGWADLVKQAQAASGVMPPAGFTVAAAPPPPSPAEQAAELVKNKQPKDMAFAEWQLVLSSGNAQAADTVWSAIKDKPITLVASVISVTPTKLTLAGSADDIDDKKADITVTMAKPIPAKFLPAVGALTKFQATASSYAPSPFMVTMTDGILFDKAGNPVGAAPAAPAHKAPVKKQ